jgi:DNA-binding transcriptional MerR regulator
VRIGELSEQSGASPRSIRHYESVGLLAPGRDSNGYREFDATAIDQVAKIKLLLQVGLDISDIVTMLPCVDTPQAMRCAHAQRRLNEQIARIERQQQLLARAKSLLFELRARPDELIWSTPAANAATYTSGETIHAVSGNLTTGVPR